MTLYGTKSCKDKRGTEKGHNHRTHPPQRPNGKKVSTHALHISCAPFLHICALVQYDQYERVPSTVKNGINDPGGSRLQGGSFMMLTFWGPFEVEELQTPAQPTADLW